ncbi:helix-turn-helix domain-containing protein [Epilithonimonas arachidiradicis]|nr:helix-turn-helix domain-containing protein [Epilithonimonas arachidiradicis]
MNNRQQMANLTGLCVETTIRTLKAMEKKNLLKIRNRKILY